MTVVSTFMPGLVKLCGMLAPPASMAVTLAPIPTIQKITSKKSVMNFPLLPYSSMFVNSFLWTVYGLLMNEQKIWVTNAFGFILSFYYFFQFQKFCPKHVTNLPGKLSHHVRGTTFIILVTAISAFSMGKSVANVIGKAGVLICCLLFFSPLSTMSTVIQTKSAKSIPFPFTIACCINCFLWAFMGLGMGDFNVYFPNVVGLIFSLTQLFLKVLYRNEFHNNKKEETYNENGV